MPITVLEEQVINQIAAGEVVERPASAVKELVENALDAGARRVQVTVERGGLGLLRVTDDGCGIAPGEVELAFARHATSKLQRVEDLWSLATLGFRGEALPSIAAVAEVTLTTRPPDLPLGRQVVVVGGESRGTRECGAPAGTTVEVRELFFNTPARRKFLKSEAAEGSRLANLLTGLALVRPDVAFTLVSEGRTVFSTAGDGDLRETFARLLGHQSLAKLVPVAGGRGDLTISGFVAAPELTWANRAWELFAVNGRLIESRLLQTATERAYAGHLPVRRYPVALLRLTVDPAQVDVNVHPAKREVRFRREGDLFQLVHQAVSAALGTQPLYRPVSAPSAAVEAVPTPLDLDWSPSATSRVAPDHVAEQPEPTSESALRYLGQLGASYLVGETPEGLVLVDQHAAHERVIFDALRAGREAGVALPVQHLLWPMQVDLAPAEAELLEEITPALTSLGFALEPFGGRSILLRSVPVLLTGIDLRQVLADLMAEGETGSPVRRTPALLPERLLQRLACRAAVKAKHPLAPAEATALLEQWHASTQPWTCPHGRPVALRWSFAEVAAAFLRR